MKTRPLVTRLRAARILLREERTVVVESEVYPDGTLPEDAARLVARFDEADGAIAEAIKLAKGAASS